MAHIAATQQGAVWITKVRTPDLATLLKTRVIYCSARIAVSKSKTLEPACMGSELIVMA